MRLKVQVSLPLKALADLVVGFAPPRSQCINLLRPAWPSSGVLVRRLKFERYTLAEIIGCYLPYLWLREGKSIWLLLPVGFMRLMVAPSANQG